MDKFKVILLGQAEKFYKKASDDLVHRLDTCFEDLERSPFQGPNIKILKTQKSVRWYRYRIGDYRVVYEIDHAVECFRYASWLNRAAGMKPWNYMGKKIKGIEQNHHNHNCFVDVHTLDDIKWLEFIVDNLGFEGMPSTNLVQSK